MVYYLSTFFNIWFSLPASLPSTQLFIQPSTLSTAYIFRIQEYKKNKLPEHEDEGYTFLRNANRHVVTCHKTKWQQQA